MAGDAFAARIAHVDVARVDVRGYRDPDQGRLRRQGAAGVRAADGRAQGYANSSRERPPDGVGGGGRRRVPLQCQERRGAGLPQQVSRLAQAHLVGDDSQDAAGPGTLGQPPEALAEAGAFGGGSQADYGKDAPTGKGDGCFLGRARCQRKQTGWPRSATAEARR